MALKKKAAGQLLRTARTLLRDAVVGYGLRRRAKGGHGSAIPTDADERRAHLARMGTSIGVRIGATRIRSIGASEERKRQLMADSAMRSAQDVLQVMGNMKGAVMKLAQMASFAIDGLPESVQQQLAQLQRAAPPMTYELASEVVEREFGSSPGEIFSEFDPVPIAAASIGQVHRGLTRDGSSVAIKVQYPGVDEAIKADLANADLLFTTIAAMFGGFDPRSLLEEVVARMTEEFNYRLEAANQRWFAAKYRGHPYVKIPEVIDEFSSQRVLTTELVDGRGFYEVLGDSQQARDTYGEIIYRFAFSSILVDGIFSGDPHPGNYLFMDDGRICFLDFGLVKKFESTREKDRLAAVPSSLLNGNRAALMEALAELGVVTSGSRLDHERIWSFFGIMFGSIIEDRPLRYTRKRVGDAMREIAMPGGELGDVQAALEFPANLAIFQRYMFGTSAVLGHLEAESNWHGITREMVFGEDAATDIGKAW